MCDRPPAQWENESHAPNAQWETLEEEKLGVIVDLLSFTIPHLPLNTYVVWKACVFHCFSTSKQADSHPPSFNYVLFPLDSWHLTVSLEQSGW